MNQKSQINKRLLKVTISVLAEHQMCHVKNNSKKIIYIVSTFLRKVAKLDVPRGPTTNLSYKSIFICFSESGNLEILKKNFFFLTTTIERKIFAGDLFCQDIKLRISYRGAFSSHYICWQDLIDLDCKLSRAPSKSLQSEHPLPDLFLLL